MTIAKDFAAKASVAFVAAAMIFTMFAPSAKAQSSEDLQKMINDLLAQIAALQSQVGQGSATTASGVCPYTWTRDLSTGATGADVMKLQQFLNANADTRVAATGAGSVGMETQYYGPATAAAVSKFQVMYRAEVLVGLVNPTGYFGPASRAKANALCVAAPVVTPGTGTGTSTDGGDTDSAALEGGAGSVSVTQTTSDVEDNINTGSSENILGFKVEAQGSDVNVSNVKVTMNYAGSASNRLERYFDSFDVVMNGEVVGTIDAADMNRDSAGKYSSNVALKNAIVRENDKNTFYVVAHAVDSLDSANAASPWTVNATSLRYEDAEGAILSETLSLNANTGVNVVKLASSTDVKVKISLDSSNPAAGAVKVSDDSSGDLVTLLTFKVKAEGTDIDFDQVKFKLATTSSNIGTMVSEYRLMRGSDLVQTADSSDISASGTDAILTMSLDDSEMVEQDDTQVYSLVVKMNKNTFVGSSIMASMSSASSYWLNASDMNGDSIADARFSGSAVGTVQTFRADGLFADSTSVTATMLNTGGNNSFQYGQFKFVMDVTADGEDYYFASTSDPIAFTVVDGGGNTLVTASSTATLSSSATKTAGGDYVIYDGQTKSVTYTVTMTKALSGSYKAVLSTFDFGDAANALTNQTAINLTPVSDFTSDSVTIVQ